jgi:hypothetical protein
LLDEVHVFAAINSKYCEYSSVVVVAVVVAVDVVVVNELKV